MPIYRHTKIFNFSKRRSLIDSVGIMIQGELVYHNTAYWISHDPLSLWNSILHQKISLTHDAYAILKSKMKNLYPEIVEEGAERKARASMLKKAKIAIGDSNLRIAE